MSPNASRLALVALCLATGACSVHAGDSFAECKASRDPAQKIAMCTEAIATPGRPAEEVGWAYFHRGVAYSWSNRADEAMADMDAAVARNPKVPDILAGRAGQLTQVGRYDEAQRGLDAALAIDPRNIIAIGNRGVLRERRGDYAGSRADMHLAAQLDPTNYQSHSELCWVGAILMDEPKATEAACAKALAMGTRDPNNFNNLGFLRFRQGRYAEAISAYDQSIAGNPEVASSFLMRGLAKQALGQPGGEEDIAKGLQIDPGVAARYASYGVDTSAAKPSTN